MLRFALLLAGVLGLASTARGAGDDGYGFVSGLVAARLNPAGEAGGVEVITAEDLRRMMELEGSRQLAGCEEESGCFAEIGNAMNANLVVYGTVDDLGGALLLQVTLLDTKTGAIRSRAVEQATSMQDLARAAEKIGDTLRAQIGTEKPQRVLVFDIKPRRKGEPEAQAAINPWPFVGGALAAAGVGVAVVGGVLDWQSVSIAEDTNTNAGLSAASARELHGQSDLYAWGAGAAYVAGAVLAVGGVSLMVMTLGAE